MSHRTAVDAAVRKSAGDLWNEEDQSFDDTLDQFRAPLACATLLAAALGVSGATAGAQQQIYDPTKIPSLEGIWDGTTRARPVNSESVPWGKDNFPVLNERALAYQKVFDEALSPKYDCQPSSSPAIQYDPYSMQVLQWPDRVIFRYEKDDQIRTVWLDGRKPTI